MTLTLLQTSPDDVKAQLARAPYAVRWIDDARGVPVILVVARDRKALATGAYAFGQRGIVPDPGWVAMPR